MVAPAAVVTTANAASPTRSSSYLQPGSALGRRRLSSLPHPAASRIDEEVLHPPVSDHVVLLLQEWLTIVKFPQTLRCLLDEYRRELQRAPPPMDMWFELTQQLDVPTLAAHRSDANQSSNSALLERIVEAAFRKKENAKQPLPTTVVVSKRPVTASASLKFASKRSLPVSSSIVQSKSTPTFASPVRRPKSAVVVAASKSTCQLRMDRSTKQLTRLDEDRATSPQIQARSNNDHDASPSKRGPKRDSLKSPERRSSRPTSASPTAHRDSSMGLRKPSASSPSASPTATGKEAATSFGRSRSSRLLSVQASSSHQLLEQLATTRMASLEQPDKEEGDGAIGGGGGGGGDPEEANAGAGDDAAAVEKAYRPVIELEDMNEERLTEQFGAFSKGTIKKLRRVLAKSSAHSQELQRTRKAMEKIQLKAQQQHERSNLAVQQTELLSSTMDMLTKEPCSLCRFVFLKKNLTTKVSYKSICDLRSSWAAAKKAAEAKTKRVGPENAVVTVLAPEDDEAEDDEEDEDLKQAQTLESAQQISHLYDEVPVCVFCAQLVLDFPSYRPSSAEQKRRNEAKRRFALDLRRQRNAQRQLDRLKCDPLDFHAFELNSDGDEDGDDASGTEEVLEVDADGRVRVVRRRVRRRRTARVPAQTGLVSKRIHYDHLRSQSVHALNRKEWEVISRSPV